MTKLLFNGALVCVFGAATLSAQGNGNGGPPEINPDGKGNRPNFVQPPGQAGKGKPQGGNGISYHGGPVILGGTNLYYIWYGAWTDSTQSILTDFGNSIGGTPYFNINTSYYDGANNHVTNQVALVKQTSVGYPYGNSLSDSQIQQVVTTAINGGALPWDARGVYFVLTSSDVTASSGFCTQYCGWHTAATLTGKGVVMFAFVGDPRRCPTACAASEIQSSSPNGNLGADGMASIIAHELEEATTDPQLNAWFDVRGAENADKCAWTFGTTSTKTAGGATYTYNVTMGTRDYLIQRNWVNANGGYCSMFY